VKKRSLAPRIWLAAATGIVVVAAGLIGSAWYASLLPTELDPATMGYPDYGTTPDGAEHAGHPGAPRGADDHTGHGSAGTPVARLVEPRAGEPDRRITLTARDEGERITLNGQSPGPELRFGFGELVEVVLVNESVAGGATLHWHGIDVPNAMDGVAGVTQDAVMPGGRFVYRFVADQPGTYWYHAHQLSSEQVRRGLLGAVIVADPPATARTGAPASESAQDEVVLLHQYGVDATLGGRTGTTTVPAPAGRTVRVRVINTDNALTALWVTGAPFRVIAADGIPLNRPDEASRRSLGITAGGRADLLITVPEPGVRIDFGGTTALVLGRDPANGVLPEQPAEFLDLLDYGAPVDPLLDTGASAGSPPGAGAADASGSSSRDREAIRLRADPPDRSFEYRIGRRLGFLDGRPGSWWTINDRMFPDVPMFMVRQGEAVRMRVENRSGASHPMHLHGHHALVLSRNGVAASGSPWWVDSIEVAPGDTWEIAFRADNPGIWMDHCHNLPHASEGLVAHLMYAGVSSSYRIGGAPGNQPE